MNTYAPIILTFLTGAALILYILEKDRRARLEENNKNLQAVINQLDEQARMIIKTDLELNKVQEELDKKITGLYTLHQLGRKINSTFNVEDLFSLIKPPLVAKLGFTRGLIMIKDEKTGNIITKTCVGYSANEIKIIERELNKGALVLSLLKKGKFLMVNRDLEKIENEDALSNIFKTESFLTVPIVAKDDSIGFIFMGNLSHYSKITDGDVELLSILASQIGTAIENTSLYAELFSSYQALEGRVKERTQELARLNEELTRLNKVKSDFVSAVSHELRTPLTSIKGYASILMTGKLGEVSPEQKERLQKIDKHSNNLARLVNNLLDISRIESGKVQMNIKDISIKEMLDSIVDIMAPQAKEKNITLKVNLKTKSDKIKADPSQLERVFINLVGNAVKFTPEKGKITISCRDYKDGVEFSVEDTGMGIPKDDVGKVFEEFFRSDNALYQKIKGTGLGLSLVKKIIAAHKGNIWVESELGKGTKFSFTVPKT